MKLQPCHTPFGDLALTRYPARSNEPLQAWCSADLLLLQEVHRLGADGSRTLVINDAHGILALATGARYSWTDSWLSARAMRDNSERNGRAPAAVLWSTQAPPASDVVLLRVPKLKRYFQYQLTQLAAVLPAGATVLAAGMDKHLSPHTAALLERCIGPTRRHRGQKKARLFTAVRDPDTRPPEFEEESGYCLDALDMSFNALPNVFSAEKLDGGARFLLDSLETLEPAGDVLDLACGNGVLGLVAWHRGIARRVTFIDESAQAIDSARANAARLLPHALDALTFEHGDGLEASTAKAYDLILCNPPFHLEHTVDDYAGRRLLEPCAANLAPGGRLLLVANRHLDYLPVLKRGFEQRSLIDENRRYRLWLSRRALG